MEGQMRALPDEGLDFVIPYALNKQRLPESPK